nr:MAG TPA: hypothetical protein [Bacteriophage sp.]
MKDFFKNKKIFFKKVLDSLLKVEYTVSRQGRRKENEKRKITRV